jgi:4-aminobutyrate aminotransferase-like enzyme
MLFIVDEAQTGLVGRKVVRCEHYEITPDILVVSKGAGGGFPCSAVITTAEIADKIQRRYHNFSSHQSDPAAAAAFLAVVDIIEKHDLVKHAADMGIILSDAWPT